MTQYSVLVQASEFERKGEGRKRSLGKCVREPHINKENANLGPGGGSAGFNEIPFIVDDVPEAPASVRALVSPSFCWGARWAMSHE